MSVLRACALACLLLARAAVAQERVGADFSDVPRAEAGGAVFREVDGTPGDPLVIAAHHGVTVARVRVWHTPASDDGLDLAGATRLAARARAAGMQVWLDLHCSDTWADPSRQTPPRAWRDLADSTLAESLRASVRGAIAAVHPSFVQVGNEITNGILWPAGRLHSDADWPRLARLLAAGLAGVRDAAGGDTVVTVLHLDAGGDSARCVAFARQAALHGVRPDAWAVSYYPWWHGPLAALRGTIAALGRAAATPVWIAETAYPWTLAWQDARHNLVGMPSQCLAEFPPSRDGQRAFVSTVRRSGAAGTLYWGAAAISAPRAPSSWENCALFDDAGRWTDAIR